MWNIAQMLTREQHTYLTWQPWRDNVNAESAFWGREDKVKERREREREGEEGRGEEDRNRESAL